MPSFKLRALAGVCALLGAAGLGASSHAQTTISGGGSTLIAPYWGQAALCLDNNPQNRSYLVAGIPTAPASVLPTSVSDCPHFMGDLFQYDSAGAGAGQAGLLAHAAVIQDIQNGAATLMFGSQDVAGTVPVFPSIQYALSDNSLGNNDLVTYDKGVNASETLTFNGNVGTFFSPATYQGLTFDSSGSVNGGASGTDYPISKALYGPLVQFPVAISPVAITFNDTFTSGGVQHSFNVQNNGTLHLDRNAYCRIFTGAITDWNDPALTVLNGGVSLTGGVSVLIKMIAFKESSGETSILTRHLAAVCGSSIYTTGVTTLPAVLVNPNPSSGFISGKFNLYQGAVSVAKAVEITQAAIAYIGSDYVAPGSFNTGATPGFGLPAAALQNGAGAFELPTGGAAQAAFGVPIPPQSNRDGSFNATITTSDRRDPTQWVQSNAPTAPLANPTAANAYPIVGTTNFIGYTCYADAAQLNLLKNMLEFNMGTLAATTLNNAGQAQLPEIWINAIESTFVENNGDANWLNLFLATTELGSSTGSPVCAAPGIVGG